MLFQKLGKFIAYAAVILGVFRSLSALVVAFAFQGHPDAVSRYLGSVQNTGEAVNQGLVYVVGGVVIGLLVQIAKCSTAKEEQN